MTKKSRESVAELTELGSLTKIHPEVIQQLDGSDDIYPLIRNLRQIFYNITPIKSKATVTAQMFEKLYAKKVVKNCGIQKIDMSLAFQASLGGNTGVRAVNFISFCHIMFKFYEAKMVNQSGYAGEFE